MQKLKTGINGFGRFGIHFLKYWLDRNKSSNFSILFINDEFLKPDQILEILQNDKFCKFHKLKFILDRNILIINLPDGQKYEIKLLNKKIHSLSWLKKIQYLIECSGKYTERKFYRRILKNKNIKILFSATSWDCDQTIVYGFNENKILKRSRSISYGSCTVNAYVPLANFINKKFLVQDSDVNVIHNIQSYKLEKFNTLNRKFCTLEKSGPNLLSFLNKENFKVNYTVVPYDGVSIIDFRFRIKKNTKLIPFLKKLKEEIRNGSLKNLYSLVKIDNGPEIHKFTSNSAVMIENSIKIINNSIYISSYFDNENSVNRYYDLLNFIASNKKIKYTSSK